MTRKPNFFIVGEPKSGTSAIYDFLNQHQDIFMCPQKEPFYFCTDYHIESDKFHGKKLYYPFRTKRQYLRLFRGAKDEKIVGEATPEYLNSKTAAKNIYDFNPKSKILIMLRDPVDSLYSLYKHFLIFGAENIGDFKKAIQAEKTRKEGKDLPANVENPSRLYYLERVRLTEKIKRYLKYFPKSDIKIVLYDDFKLDNKKAYADILGFLNLDCSFQPDFRIHGKTNSPQSSLIPKFFSFLSKTRLKLLLPLRLRQLIGHKLLSLSVSTERQKLPPEQKKQLKKIFRPEIIKLNKFLHEQNLIKKQADLTKLWDYS